MLYHGDCLDILKNIENDYIDMIYLDPPFFTQKTQKLSDSEGNMYQFSDTWKSKEAYLNYLECRLVELKRVLKNDGSIFFHCDHSASWNIKILLDSIFGEKNFRSEIVWSYKRWSNSQKGLIPNHQTIFYYSKSSNYKFNTIYGEYSPTTNIDQILQERVRNKEGKTVYKTDDYGNVVNVTEKKGVPMSDVWEIPFLNPKAKERVGYPTQKPIELLDRIIKISTNENDIVLDPFCGSGTTLVSAKLLNRNYIGIDVSEDAIKLSKSRLDNPLKTESGLLAKGKASYKTKTEKELKILDQFDCDIVQRNKGIDAFLKKYYNDSPVAIKIKKETETLQESIELLNNAGIKKKCSFTVLIVNKKDEHEISTLKIPHNMIILCELDSLLDGCIEDMIQSVKRKTG